MDEMTCPQCGRRDGQLKIGQNASGSQRYLGTPCQRKYTPAPHPIGYPDDVRQQAIRLYGDRINFRRIGRLLGLLSVRYQRAANGVAAYAHTLPETRPTGVSAAAPPASAGGRTG